MAGRSKQPERSAKDRSAPEDIGEDQADQTTPLADGLQPSLLVTVEEAGRLLGIGRTKAYGLVKEGWIKSVTIGRRRLVIRSSISKLVEMLASGEISI